MNRDIEINILPLNPKIYVLDNGVKVYLFENKNMNIIKMDFFFANAGITYQPKIYLSRLANSQISEGSNKYSASKIANTIDYYGAFMEKNLVKEAANISFYFLEKYKDNLLPYIEDMIINPIFPQKEMDLTIEKLRQQYLINQQKTEHIALINFYEAVFGKKHPFGVIGSLEDYDIITREDMKDFHKAFYTSEDLFIILSGGVEESFIPLLNRAFGSKGWKREKEIRLNSINYNNDNRVKKKRNLIIDNAVQTSIRLGLITIPASHKDYMSLSILNCLLGGYFGSRLMSNIREEKGYTYGINSVLHSFKDNGILCIIANIAGDKASQAIDEIYKEMDILRSEMVSEEELLRVKNALRGNLLRSLDGSFEMADAYSTIFRYGLGNDYYNRYLDIIANIRPEDILRLAQTYFKVEEMIEVRAGNIIMT